MYSLMMCFNTFYCIFLPFSKQVNSLAVSMDGTLLLSGSEDQTAHVWHVHSRQCLRVVNHKGTLAQQTHREFPGETVMASKLSNYVVN